MQTLGKVGPGRRVPPANLPSLRSESGTPVSGTSTTATAQTTNANSGWTPSSNDTIDPSQNSTQATANSSTGQIISTVSQQAPGLAGQVQSHPLGQAASAAVQGPATGSCQSVGLAKASWNVAQEADGHGKNSLGQVSRYFPQEFPQLSGGPAPPVLTQKLPVDASYGPGPSLRPQTEGSWIRGTSQGNQPPNNGSGVNGQYTERGPGGQGGPPGQGYRQEFVSHF